MTYKALDLFIGQGVSHATLWYGTVHGLEIDEQGRPGTVSVGFCGDEQDVPAASLSQAHIPDDELLRLRTKIAEREAQQNPLPARQSRKAKRRNERVGCRVITQALVRA